MSLEREKIKRVVLNSKNILRYKKDLLYFSGKILITPIARNYTCNAIDDIRSRIRSLEKHNVELLKEVFKGRKFAEIEDNQINSNSFTKKPILCLGSKDIQAGYVDLIEVINTKGDKATVQNVSLNLRTGLLENKKLKK